MLLVFEVMHPNDGDIRPLMFYSECLETGIDLLNHYVKIGHSILSAVTREADGTEIVLPIEAIDGESVKESIHQLQNEWEEILRIKA